MVNVKPLILHWHQDSLPVYSISFQPPNKSDFTRFATAGGDHNIRIWELQPNNHIEYLSTITAHERAVNTVEFSPNGQILASASDDGQVCLFVKSKTLQPAFGSDLPDLETWKLLRKCRTASFGEIYDLCWSPNGQFLAAASMDKTVSILNVADGTCLQALRDHKHYVQGVTWDPQNQFLATQSSDQRVIVYLNSTKPQKPPSFSLLTKIEKTENSSFLPESFPSFFRRLSFSLNGELLLVPAATSDDKPCCLVYLRNHFKNPVIILPLAKNSFSVKFNPLKFKLKSGDPVLPFEYKLVYAVGTLQGVNIYNTEQLEPVCMVSNIHYSSLTSLDWSPDGRKLLLTSIDGFCTLVDFEEGELGIEIEGSRKLEGGESTSDMPDTDIPDTDIPGGTLSGTPDNVPGETAQPIVHTLTVRRKKK